MLCILYVVAVGTLLGIVGLLVERVLPPTAPRRWVWCAIIPISMVIPGVYRWHHNWAVTEFPAHQEVRSSLSHSIEIASLTPLDRDWWARTESYDTAINQVWLIVSGMLVLWGLTNAMRVSHIVSSSHRGRDIPRQLSMLDGIPVVVTDVAGPATVGLFRSRVLVPRWVLALPGMQRQYVLRHEEEHRRAHDARLLFVASLPLILMPWNLALWWQLRRLCLAVEMDCDNRVVAALGDANAYGELLLKVAQAGSRGPRLQPAFLGMGMLERRLNALLAPAQLRNFQRFLLPAAALSLLLLVLWMPHPIVGHDSHAHATMISNATTTPSVR
ncbi:MAG TPA: M56 family metallopeptidase [Gemmatimonadaceae bacterium]|nr:M56 family metallopeptidase [Gemmatimonadaceae bacterium]